MYKINFPNQYYQIQGHKSHPFIHYSTRPYGLKKKPMLDKNLDICVVLGKN